MDEKKKVVIYIGLTKSGMRKIQEKQTRLESYVNDHKEWELLSVLCDVQNNSTMDCIVVGNVLFSCPATKDTLNMLLETVDKMKSLLESEIKRY